MNTINIRDKKIEINGQTIDHLLLKDELEKLRDNRVTFISEDEQIINYVLEYEGGNLDIAKLLFEEYNCQIDNENINNDLLNNISYFEVSSEKKEKSMESLLTCANGYFSMRGNLSFLKNGEDHYGASYIAGLYDTAITRINNHDVYNEDFVNIGNFNNYDLYLDGELIDVINASDLQVKRNLCLNTGVLTEVITFTHLQKQVTINTQRYVSMNNKNYGRIKMNVSGDFLIKVEAIYDLDISNKGVERYQDLNSKHLSVSNVDIDNNSVKCVLTTLDSKLDTYVRIVGGKVRKDDSLIISTYEAQNNLDIIREVYVGSEDVSEVDGNSEYELHLRKITEILDENYIKVKGDNFLEKMININRYHLHASLSHHNLDLDNSITARGLHGEAYRGHIFWDEIFLMPYYLSFNPEIVKSCLMYRYKRLDAARENAKLNNYTGAMYPWQSGMLGDEQTQTTHLNPISGNWDPDYSSFQRHVGLAICYNVIKYYEATNDGEFLQNYGLEILEEVVTFFSDKCVLIDGKYSLLNVMGPNEFHEESVNSPGGGLKDNAYTNFFLAYVINKLCTYETSLDKEKLNEIASSLNFNISDNIIEQFDGFFELQELDFDAYREKYTNIYRMDRILKSEGKDPSDYQVCKQADLLMIFYLFTRDEINSTFSKMDIEISDEIVQDNIKYYLKRTTHGSTLSRIVHADIIRLYTDEYENSYEMYKLASGSDYTDIQGGTTAEGIHTGVMGASNYEIFKSFLNIDFNNDELIVEPYLGHLKQIEVKTLFKGKRYFIKVDSKESIIEEINQNI